MDFKNLKFDFTSIYRKLNQTSDKFGLAINILSLLLASANSRGAVVSYWQKDVHEVLVNCLGGLSLPRKSVVRLTDRPNMILDVYRGRKTTEEQQHHQTGQLI